MFANLWHGRVPLGRAFWLYAVVCGALINGYATLISFAIISTGGSAALAMAVHVVPGAWNILAAVGVWRSAGQPGVTPHHASLARAGIVVWTLLLFIL